MHVGVANIFNKHGPGKSNKYHLNIARYNIFIGFMYSTCRMSHTYLMCMFVLRCACMHAHTHTHTHARARL